eukprot:Nk52_evm11s255 gene=Nk52_evmTU11s255
MWVLRRCLGGLRGEGGQAVWKGGVVSGRAVQKRCFSQGGSVCFEGTRQSTGKQGGSAAWGRELMNNPGMKYGLPMVLFIVLGALGLSEFTSNRYEAYERKVKKMSRDELVGTRTRKFNIDEEYKRLKDMELDNKEYPLVKITTPWDLAEKARKEKEEAETQGK